MNFRNNTLQGSVIVLALLFAAALGLLMYSMLSYGVAERRLNLHHETRAEARYAAEACLEYGIGEMQLRIRRRSSTPSDTMLSTGTPLALPPEPFFAGSRVDFSSLRVIGGRFSDPATVTLPAQPAADTLAGRTVKRRVARIFAQATARDPGNRTGVTYWCSTDLQIRRPNWFDGLGDYLPDLEIAPGPDMKTYGKFQTAGNLYYQANNSLEFWGKVICAGSLFWGRKPGSGQSNSSGNVSIANTSNTLVSLNHGGSWVTSATADFNDLSMSLWGGNLLTGALDAEVPSISGFGDYTPYLASDPASNPVHQIIEIPKVKTDSTYDEDVEPQKIGAKAGLVIYIPATGTPVAYRYEADVAGNYDRIDRLENPGTYKRKLVTLPAGLVKSATMTDKRRAATALKMWDVDIGKLQEAINTSTPSAQIGNFNKDTDWNGVVYVEVEAPNSAGVRVHNGKKIPNYGVQSGLTFGTNAPLYVRGNFNADGSLPGDEKNMGKPESGEPPAALVADAITILSNNWSDSNSSKALSDRKASVTEVAAALIGGIVPSSGGKYSGGFENYPRFLENWSGIVFGYRGAVVALYDSEIATQPWGSSDVYEAPSRRWAYNELFLTDTPDFAPARSYPNRVGYTEYRSQAEFDAAVAAATAAP